MRRPIPGIFLFGRNFVVAFGCLRLGPKFRGSHSRPLYLGRWRRAYGLNMEHETWNCEPGY